MDVSHQASISVLTGLAERSYQLSRDAQSSFHETDLLRYSSKAGSEMLVSVVSFTSKTCLMKSVSIKHTARSRVMQQNDFVIVSPPTSSII